MSRGWRTSPPSQLASSTRVNNEAARHLGPVQWRRSRPQTSGEVPQGGPAYVHHRGWMASSTDNFFASVCRHPPNQKLVRHLPWKEQPTVSYQPSPSGTAQLSSPPPLDLPHYGIGFVDAVKRGFKKYATFTGRASRTSTGGGRCSPSSSTWCSVW